jgi:mannose-6-phosphate isomerase-like protein (cupin superfamily)
MAVITLKPGERFAHSHDVVSTTRLVTGNVDLTVGDVTVRLTAVPISVPAATVHTVHNVGTKIAKVECDYGLVGDHG